MRVEFQDSSTLQLGGDSRFEISEFHHDTDTGSGRSLFNVIRGWLRTRTGQNDDVEVRTRYASIGVRGTEFTVEYGESDGIGKTTVTVEFGEVEVTERSTGRIIILGFGESVTLEEPLPDLSDQPMFGQSKLSVLPFDPSEGFRMAITGPPGSYQIDVSDDLLDWNPLEEVSLALDPVVAGDPASSGLPQRFYRIGEVSLFPEYHFLMSVWGLEAESGLSTFRMGFEQPDAVFLDLDSEHVIVSQASEVFSRASVTGGQSVLAADHDGAIGGYERVAAFADGGLTLFHPEESDGDASLSAWELVMEPLGSVAPGAVVADALTGTGFRQSTPAGGAERFEYIQAFAAKKSENAGIDDIVGEWGIVRLEIESLPERIDGPSFDPAEILYTSLSVPATITANNGGTFTIDGVEMESEIVQFFDGTPPERRRFEPAAVAFDFPIHVTPSGETFIEVLEGREGQEHQNMTGFMSPAGDFMAFGEGWPSIHEARTDSVSEGAGESFAAHQLLLGVRLDSDPDLAGHEYRLTGQSFWVSRWDFEMIPSGPDKTGTLSFNENAETAILTLEDLNVRVPFGNANDEGILIDTEDPDELPPLDYVIDPDGRLNFDMSPFTDEPGVDAFFSGFVQEGGRVLVLALGFVEDAGSDGDEGQISLWVASCTNCD